MRKLCWIAIAILFSIFACTKIETTNIGSGLIPPIDGVTTLDTTLGIITNNFIDPISNSLRVYKSDDHVIGVINNDPVFGKTTAETYFELKPTSYKFSFPGGASVIADSAVLILSYKGSYGDSTIHQMWEVKELAGSPEGDSAYPVSTQFPTGTVLGTKDVDITTFDDSVNNKFENASYQIRIPLDQSFANRLIKQYDSTSGNAYENDSLFRLNFKGFAVGPTGGSSGNALIRINLTDTNTKLALFYNYKIPDSANPNVEVKYFRFNTDTDSKTIAVSASANYIKRDRDGSKLGNSLNGTNANDSLLYIQTSPGTFTTVKIPDLEGFKNSIIHRAELTVYQAPEIPALNASLTPPRYLLLSGYDSEKGVKTNVPNDFVVDASSGSNVSTFGGYLFEKNVPDYGTVKAYRFDLSRYVQGIVTRNDSSLTLRLSAPSNDSLLYTGPYPATTSSTLYIAPSNANNVADGRVVLKGGGAGADDPLRMCLHIIYSKLED